MEEVKKSFRPRLLVDFEPEADESITAWIARLAACVPVSIGEMFREVALSDFVDLDLEFDDVVAQRIAAAAGKSVELVKSLRSCFGYRPPDQLAHMLRCLPTPSFTVCPSCLEEDEQPYFRQAWRVRLVTVCSKHRCLLMDRCPHCGTQINIRNKGVARIKGREALRYCQGCARSLGEVRLQALDESQFRSLMHMQSDWQRKISCNKNRYWLSNLSLKDAEKMNTGKAFELCLKYSDSELGSTVGALVKARTRLSFERRAATNTSQKNLPRFASSVRK